MAEGDRNSHQIIKVPAGGITIWKPNKALPVLGAATALWAGRRILRYALRQRTASSLRVLQKQPSQQSQQELRHQELGGYTVTYHYQARWTIRVQPDDER